jgi:hypothetical protein
MDTIIQDELETVPLYPILSIRERNLAFMWVCGNSRIQLELNEKGTSVRTYLPPIVELRNWLRGPMDLTVLSSSSEIMMGKYHRLSSCRESL